MALTSKIPPQFQVHNKNLDIFIYSHIPFRPCVTNPVYKILTCSHEDFPITKLQLYRDYNYEGTLSYDNLVWNEYSGIHALANDPKIKLKKYVGMNHYRRYFYWMDKVPEMDVMFENFDIPEMRESIDRPVVHSGELTAEMNAATHLQVGRETALWRLFAARAETEPEVALLPALRHYREALRLLSSIRQERNALVSDDFKLYQHLLEERRKYVNEWFVVLDKAVAMRDWDRARQQAKWIMDHATLTGERVDVRRAADILATKIPPEDGDGTGK